MAATPLLDDDRILRRISSIRVALDSASAKPLKVVAFGSVCTDTFWYFDKIPMETKGKDQFFRLQLGSKIPCPTIEDSTGGSAANIASGLTKLGCSTTLLAAIGEDSVGAIGVKELKHRGVDVSGISRVPGRSDMSTIVRMKGVNDRTIFTFKGAVLTPSTVKADLIVGADLFMWCSVANKLAVDAIKRCIAVCKANNIKVAAAPSEAMIRTHPADMLELLGSTHLLSLNDDEIKLLTNTTTVPSAIVKLLRMFPQLEVLQVTRGKDPSLLMYRLGPETVRVVKTTPPDVKILDKTGAGDAACAGLLFAYLRRVAPEMAAKYSATTSTSKITGFTSPVPFVIFSNNNISYKLLPSMNITARGAAAGLLTEPGLMQKIGEYIFEQSSFTSSFTELDRMPDI
ncbi:carbohydrate kinase family protein [Pelomyxa schiedti]|nr:carbohydrate kinase family protein [Pelomyxa schiedti]